MRSIKSRSGDEGYDFNFDTNFITLKNGNEDKDDGLTNLSTLPEPNNCSLPPPVQVIPWSNVIFTKDSNTQFTLTYRIILNRPFVLFFISSPLSPTATISDINTVYKNNPICEYNYKNNNDPVLVRKIISGKSIRGFNENELQLPRRFIVFIKDTPFTPTLNTFLSGYFYLDVVYGKDGNQKVTLST
jgi:hypothetical protein